MEESKNTRGEYYPAYSIISISNERSWHADVNPDNILLVDGKFKLADPGFAKFVKKTDEDPTEILLGGTETYSTMAASHIFM
jgi:hypothetical protein